MGASSATALSRARWSASFSSVSVTRSVIMKREVPEGHTRARRAPLEDREMSVCGTKTRAAANAGADQGLVADEPQREAVQDRRKGRPPRPLCRLPDGRGRHPTADVPGDFAPDRGTTTTTASSTSMRRSIAIPFDSNRREEYVQMPGKMTNSILRPPFRPPQGSRPQLASILREGRKSVNIHLSSGVIWGIPA
jgi:hypothetical protein